MRPQLALDMFGRFSPGPQYLGGVVGGVCLQRLQVNPSVYISDVPVEYDEPRLVAVGATR